MTVKEWPGQDVWYKLHIFWKPLICIMISALPESPIAVSGPTEHCSIFYFPPSCVPPWSQPTSDMCTVVREGAHKFWSFLGSFFGIMTKLMGSWAHSFNSWALLLGRHWTHGLICPKNCKNFKSWALSFLSIHEQKSNAPIWNIFSTAGALVVVRV